MLVGRPTRGRAGSRSARRCCSCPRRGTREISRCLSPSTMTTPSAGRTGVAGARAVGPHVDRVRPVAGAAAGALPLFSGARSPTSISTGVARQRRSGYARPRGRPSRRRPACRRSRHDRHDRDKCTGRVDLRPHVGVAKPMTQPRHAAHATTASTRVISPGVRHEDAARRTQMVRTRWIARRCHSRSVSARPLARRTTRPSDGRRGRRDEDRRQEPDDKGGGRGRQAGDKPATARPSGSPRTRTRTISRCSRSTPRS